MRCDQLKFVRGFVCPCICTASELWINASVSNRMTGVAEKLQRKDRKLLIHSVHGLSHTAVGKCFYVRAVRIILDRWQQMIICEAFRFR